MNDLFSAYERKIGELIMTIEEMQDSLNHYNREFSRITNSLDIDPFSNAEEIIQAINDRTAAERFEGLADKLEEAMWGPEPDESVPNQLELFGERKVYLDADHPDGGHFWYVNDDGKVMFRNIMGEEMPASQQYTPEYLYEGARSEEFVVDYRDVSPAVPVDA